jgi:hypothetical protein
MPFDDITFEGDFVSPFQGFNLFGAACPRALPWAVMLGRFQLGADLEDAHYSRRGTPEIFDRRFDACPCAGPTAHHVIHGTAIFNASLPWHECEPMFLGHSPHPQNTPCYGLTPALSRVTARDGLKAHHMTAQGNALGLGSPPFIKP